VAVPYAVLNTAQSIDSRSTVIALFFWSTITIASPRFNSADTRPERRWYRDIFECRRIGIALYGFHMMTALRTNREFPQSSPNRQPLRQLLGQLERRQIGITQHLSRPYRASNKWVTDNPGRCPGLRYRAPLALRDKYRSVRNCTALPFDALRANGSCYRISTFFRSIGITPNLSRPSGLAINRSPITQGVALG